MSNNKFNTLRPRLNYRYSADDIFKFMFFYDLTKMSLKFIPKSPIINNSSLDFATNRRQAIIIGGLVYCRIYESFGLDDVILPANRMFHKSTYRHTTQPQQYRNNNPFLMKHFTTVTSRK